MSTVPEIRIRELNDRPRRSEREYVLYWMVAFRRKRYNFALERAVEIARELKRPLLVFEALRCDYPWASDRLHRFVLEGMAANERRFESSAARYFPYVETTRGVGKGLLEALAERACAVVTDDFPAFFVPRMLAAAAKKLDVTLEAVDANGIFPLRATDRVFTVAHSFRRFLDKEILPYLRASPKEDPLARVDLPPLKVLPREITERWPLASHKLLNVDPAAIAALPIDHDVGPGALRGGASSARTAWKRFLRKSFEHYDVDRNHPDADATSGLSPYLHFGHISTHEVLLDVLGREEWTEESVVESEVGKREWWGVSANAAGFIDELVTWRELGFNLCAHTDDYDRYESLPDWARETLEAHEGDEREHVYSLEEFDRAETHDAVWNAAQRQLLREGRLHNYMRMLWGKKILEWSETPRDALAVMIELNNRYALDGRDPNSYSGIFWCLGRYDRPWGPERPIFGKVRYMSSERTRKKLRVGEYLERYAED